MRSMYQINADLDALLSKVDEETGELLIDPEALDALMMERTEKMEGMALKWKNLNAYAEEIKAQENILKTEIAALAERRASVEKDRDSLKDYLEQCLAGEKLETAKVRISYRRSSSVEIDPELFWQNPAAAFVRYKDPEPDKKAISDALKSGGIVPGAKIVEKTSMSIK